MSECPLGGVEIFFFTLNYSSSLSHKYHTRHVLSEALEHTELIEIHQASAEVPVQAESEEVDDDEEGEGGEEVVGPVQDVEGAVAQESDINVVAQSDQPQRVAKHGRNEPVTL